MNSTLSYPLTKSRGGQRRGKSRESSTTDEETSKISSGLGKKLTQKLFLYLKSYRVFASAFIPVEQESFYFVFFNVKGTKYICSLFWFPNIYVIIFLTKGHETSSMFAQTWKHRGCSQCYTPHSAEQFEFCFFSHIPKGAVRTEWGYFHGQQLPSACWQPGL